MTASCPRCHSPLLETDKFCPQCGSRIDASPTEAFQPVPGVTEAPDLRVRRTRRPKKKPVYRRGWFVVLTFLAAVILIGSASAAVYLNQKFSAFNRMSTPPPVVSLADDDAGSGDVITDPAQQALALAESGKTGEFTVGNSGGGADPAGTPGAGSATFSLRSTKKSGSGSQTILLMGVDARPGEPIDTGVRPDSLSVLHLNGKSGSCRILSIPRDTRTELPGYGPSKINHALAVGGVPYERLVVEQLLGIDIDQFALIDFAGTEELVDAVGGVTVTNDAAFQLDGHTFPVGELRLSGEEALAYARFRSDARGDFGRQERQQQVIRALISQTDGMDIVKGATSLLGAVEGHFKTSMSPKEMIDLARDYRSTCTSTTLETKRFDGAIETHQDPLLDLPLSYVVLDPADIEANVAWLMDE